MLNLLLTGAALKVIYIAISLFSVTEARGFQCKAATIPSEDLESIRQLACNSLDVKVGTSPIVNKSGSRDEFGYRWNLLEPMALTQIKDGSNSQVQLNNNCEITSITVSSKENDVEICTKENSILKRNFEHVVCNGVTFKLPSLTMTATYSCKDGVIDEMQLLDLREEHYPKIFDPNHHYMNFIKNFGKVYETDYRYPSYVVFDYNCKVLGALVKVVSVFQACKLEDMMMG